MILSGAAPVLAADLGTGRLLVAGTRLTITPESQTVPFDTATTVETDLEGFDVGAGALPPDLKVVAELRGPEIDGALRLETLPNQPFRIPRFSLEGEYWLEDVRLLQGEELLAYAEPRSSAIRVTQVLVTRITSRALTLDEIRSYGVVVDPERFRAFNFTFGFAVDGRTFDYNVPVIDTVGSAPGTSVQVLGGSRLGGGSRSTTSTRFRPPRLAPFTLEVDGADPRRDRYGGCTAVEGCYQGTPVSLPGVILFPTDVSLLNQFFSVVVLAKNGAPEGDPLVVRDLTAKVSLPPGLRQAKTEPPTPLGVPVPVRVPGADGTLGTADDITFLVAQAEGQAEVLVEGRTPGTHLVEFDLQGVLDGFPDGEIHRVTGKAKGAVVVRDPTLGLNITHPEVARTDEEYSLFLTVSNTSNAPVNLVSLTLPVAALSGVQVVGTNARSIETLPPGESEVVEFSLRSLRTGRVVASAIRTGGRIDPTFEFSVAVGDGDVALSPDTIILPDATSYLPAGLVRSSLGLVGLGYSLATVPPKDLRPGLPQIGMDLLHEKVYWLAQAGRHVRLGEDAFDSLAVLAAEWTGARNPDWEWDLLRRTTQKGASVGEDLGAVFAAEAAASSPQSAFERFAATTGFLVPIQAALAEGAGVSLEVRSRANGSTLSGRGIDPLRSRGLAYGDLYHLGTAEMALLAAPEEAGYRVRLRDADGGTAALHLLVPDAAGTLRVVRWTGLSLGAGGTAETVYAAADTSFTLAVDADGDGAAESQLAGTVAPLAPRAFDAVAAVQDPVTVTGHVVEVLFTQDVDLASLSPADPSHFSLPGNLSNGGLVKREEDLTFGPGDPTSGENGNTVAENPFDGLLNTRVVRVTFDNPVSPLKTHTLAVSGVSGVSGETVTGAAIPVETTVTDPGVVVQGTVYGSDGQPVPFARVDLHQADYYYFAISNCQRNLVAEVEADAQGRFELDYVRQTRCDDSFQIVATDPTSNRRGTSVGKVRFVGGTQELDVLMLGRGTVRGRVTYEDGSVPQELQVVGYSPVFSTGYEAAYGPDGTYEIRDLPVGTISLGAGDRLGSAVYQTVEVPRAGSVVERDLTILRLPANEPTGDVRGTVLATDGATPVFDAYVALYVDGELVGVERSGGDGSFDFGTVRAGVAEIEAFDGVTGIAGAQLFFDVQPDQVNDVTVLLRDDRGTVEGHVYRQTLSTITPVANAVVWVSGAPFNTVTDATGYYRLDGVFAGSRTVMAADLETQVQTSASVTINAGGETVYRDLYLVENVQGGIAGEVLGFTGNPVAGATIHLSTGGDQWYGEYFTNFAGRFTIPDLQPGTYELHAISGGSGAVARATIRFEGETPFVRIRFQKGTIQGTAQALDGSGQAIGVPSLVTYRATVVRNGLLGLDYQAHTLETEADGSFVIPDVLAGPYQLTVTNAFHGERTFRDEITYHGEVRQHDVLFEPSGTVRGTVLDWDGTTPVPGATVHLRHPLMSEYDVVTAADGRFTFELVAPTSRRFAVDAEIERNGVFRTARVWVALNRPGQELDVEAVLPMQGTVSGWVEDAGGAPVAGAVVTLREGSYPHRELVHNADQAGSFSFTNVFAGTVALSAQAPAFGGLGGRETVEIVEEGQEVFGVLVLEGTGELTGTIYSPETGEVVPTAQVTLQRLLYGTVGDTFDSVTASAGEFRFRLLPLDVYRVRVFDPATGRFGQGDWVTLDSHGQLLTVDVTLEARGTVDGHLYEPETLLGVPGATVRLLTKSLRPFTTYSSTDVDGYFEFQGIPEGPFTLDTRQPEGTRRASGSGAIVEEDQLVTVDLYLEAVGRVVGTVLNPAGLPDGPFANANAILHTGHLGRMGTVLGASLENPYAFDGVVTGRRVSVWAAENGGDHRGRAVAELPSGQAELTLDVRMMPIGSVTVTVMDSFGAAVAGADLALTSSGFYGYERLTASTGADGRAVFQGVGEGWLGATVTQPGTLLRGSANAQLTLDGEQVQMTVTLEDSGTVTGRAVLSDGLTPAADALVALTSGSRSLQTLADANGDFAFDAVPLGTFTVFVQESFGPGTIERSAAIAANGDAVALGTLVLDDHDPAVASIEPATGSADQPLSTAVTVRFTEPIDPARWHWTWVVFRKVGGADVPFTRTWSEGDTVLTLTPNSPLDSFTAYDVIVKNANDLAGRQLSAWGRTTFNTVDVVPPTVVDVLPRDGENQVPVDASILVTFSEKVAFSSLSGSAFQLTDLTTGAGVTTTFQQLTGERQVLVTPANGLLANHEYRLTVQGVSDNGGNLMTGPVTTTFWSVDTLAPQITSVTFPAGTSYVAGDPVPVVVEATDEWGVASTTLVMGDWTWVDDLAPWELTGVVPIVATAGSLTVEIRATDVHGNVAATTRVLSVAPNPNPVAPVPAVACGRDGGTVVPGYAVELGARATDDEAVESIALFVDGQEIGRASPLDASPAEASFLWTPPAGAAAGTLYTVRLEARDFAGNVGSTQITVTTPPASATVLPFGTTLFASTYDGSDLVLANGTFLAPEALSLASLTVARSARVVSSVGSAQPLELTVAGVLDLQCGSQIDASSLGYAGGEGATGPVPGEAPAWVQASQPNAGGSHGGAGAAGVSSDASDVGDTFDSVYAPSLGGGGGATSDSGQENFRGGYGGGHVEIVASAIVLDGEIRASGESRDEDAWQRGGGGAGGGVVLRAGTLSGAGGIDVSGGATYSYAPNGSGGGGRVAIHADSVSGFDPVTQVKAWGGRYEDANGPFSGYAAPGTIYVKTLADTYGRLIMDSGEEADGTDREGPPTELPALGSGSMTAFDVSGADAWVAAAPFRPRWLGAWVVLLDASGGELGAFEVAALDPVGRILLEGAGAVAGAASYRGEYRFDRIDTLHGAGFVAATPVRSTEVVYDGAVELSGTVTAGTLRVEAGSTIRPASGGSLRFDVSGTMTVEAGAVLDVSRLGHPGGRGTSGSVPGGAPEGLMASTYDTGGSHGGAGAYGYQSANFGGAPGEVFGSVYVPRSLGGGGALFTADSSDQHGGDGGGTVEIRAGSLVLEGEILATGETRTGYLVGGGAGGSVFLDVGSLSGSGRVDVSGGHSEGSLDNVNVGGAGGGGRVSIVAGDLLGFDPALQVRAWGGHRLYTSVDAPAIEGYAAAGTLYVKEGTDVYGRLFVDAGTEPDGSPRSGPPTALPVLGSGDVVAFQASGLDALLTADTPLPPRWEGAWAVLLNGAGNELGTFRVGSVDAAGVALLEGAAAVTGATRYRGVYRFDRVENRNGAGLQAHTELRPEVMVLQGEVTVTDTLAAADLTLESGAVVQPAAGGSLRVEVPGTLTVSSGAIIDGTGRGFAGGTPTSPGGAPPGVTASASGAGGSHGGVGSKGDQPDALPGEVYDSVYQPSLAGGGGSLASTSAVRGGAGGGVLHLDVGALLLDGELRARGEQPDGTWEAGGAGGAIVVQAASLSGAGIIDASGGDASIGCRTGSSPGAGGGGRVALEVGDLTTFDLGAQVRAWGGALPDCGVEESFAAAGTIYVKAATDVYGSLILDAGEASDGSPRLGPATELPALGTGSVVAFEVSGPDAWISAASPFRERWLGAWMALLDGSGGELGVFRIAALDATGRALLEGAGSVAAPSSYRGEYRFDSLETRRGGAFEASDPVTSTLLVLSGETGVDAEITAPDVLVKSGAVVRPAAGGRIRFTVPGTLTVEAGAVIDLSGLGYPGGIDGADGGAPSGLSGSTAYAGGSHGGGGSPGEVATAVPGEVYDSVYRPSLGGGGGSSTTSGGYRGGAGGGVLELDVGSLVLHGELRARGEQPDGTWEAGGGGGAIVVQAGSISGAGLIDASGGDASVGCRGSAPGGGGGGRVALEVDDLTTFDPATQVRAWGGTTPECGVNQGYAAAGTVYLVRPTDVYGTLILDAGLEPDGTRRAGGETELPALGVGPVAALEVSGPDAWVTATAPFPERWMGAWMVLVDGSGADLGAFQVVDLDATGRSLLGGAATVTGASSYRGEYRFDRVETRNGAGFQLGGEIRADETVLTGAVEVDEPLVLPKLTLRPGSVLRPRAGGGTVDLQVTGALTVDAGASIDVSGLGYPGGIQANRIGGAPAGIAGSAVDAGGSHGGSGATWNDLGPPGDVYDSVYEPHLAGGGGSYSGSSALYSGGAGGGVLRVTAGALVLDGSLLARGLDGGWTGSSSRAAGAGGTITVAAGTLSGGGLVDGSGGSSYRQSSSGWEGSAGGGRIVLDVGSFDGFLPATQVRAWGGSYGDPDGTVFGYAAPGTVLARQGTSTHGDLRVDHGGRTGGTAPVTVLPAIGKGIVGAASADGTDPTDVWIEDQDLAKRFSLGVTGMWVRVGGVDYPVIDQSPDRRQVLLDGAAGAVATGDSYLGIYKFDSVTVAGDAHLELLDGDDVGAWQVDPGSTLTRLDLDPPAVTVTSPAAGTLFTAGDSVAIAADVTDPSGVASVTFRLGDQSFVDGAAPYEWSAVAPVVEVEQDVEVTVEAVDAEGNLGSTAHTIRVRPVAPGDPPVVTIGCPSPGARLAPGTGLDFAVTATHDDGVERVELFVGGETTPSVTDFDAPYSFRYDVPAGALDGDVVELRFRARSFGGVYGETTYPVQVIAANVVTADSFLSSADLSFDGASLVVAGGTLTVQGSHTFRDLVVLQGATVTHPATTTSGEERLELTLTRDLFVACGGTIDAGAKGYGGDTSYGSALEGAVYVSDDFSDGDLAGWQVVDHGTFSAPSNWYVRDGALYQGSNIYSNDGSDQGTFAYWSSPLPSPDYRFGFSFKAVDDDLVGAMFRYVDPQNHYRFGWKRQGGVRYLERVQDGVRTVLAEDGVSYATNTWYSVEIVAEGDRLQVWVDGARVYDVRDASHAEGSVAFFCWAQAGVYFDDARVAEPARRSISNGGSHGGRGGGAASTNVVYGNLLDPSDPGAGGGGLSGAPGGGIVRMGAGGVAVIDGAVVASGASSSNTASGAGGSVRLDASEVRGLGAIQASGGGGPGSTRAAGGGGRIALYGATIDEGLLGRTMAAGGDAATPELRGAAGTIFVKRDAQAFGDLILDNGGLDTAQPTELLGFPPGVLEQVEVSSITDTEADFVHDLSGVEVFLNGDRSALWPVTGNDHHGQTLTLDTSAQALTALVGDAYEGLYRFDRVIVRGGAEAVTQAEVQSTSAPEVDAGSSWVADHHPSVTLTSPLPGQVFTSGSAVTVSAQADDLFGVEHVELSLGGESVTDTAAPYSASFVAPRVAVPTDVAVTATLLDASGHPAETSITVRVDPNPDTVAPIVALGACPGDGDLVMGGAAVSLSFSVLDNELIESYRVLVNGVVEHEVLAVNQSSVASTYGWTPPSSAPPGTTFTVRVEALDYAGGMGYEQRVLAIPTGTVLSGDQSLDGTWSGSDLVLGPGVFTVTEPLALQSLGLLQGATVSAPAGGGLALDVTGELRVQCGAVVDVSGQGYLGGHSGHPDGYAPSGVVASSPDAGGSHGGSGVFYDGAGPAGEVYDSVYLPRLGGGGGALRNTTDTSFESGSGGGVVEIVAGSIVLDGEIRARGEDRGNFESGGAGGSVVLDVSGTLSGTGSLDAAGGDSTTTSSFGREGGGGGGRVALYVGSLLGFDPSTQVSVQGGVTSYSTTIYGYGAPGTLLVFTDGVSTYGDLYVDAGTAADGSERQGPVTELPALGSGALAAFEVAGVDAWVTGASAFPVRWLGARMVLEDAAGASLGAFEVVELDVAGRGRLAGAGGVASPAAYRGEYRFDAVTLRNGAGLVASDRLEAGSLRAEGGSRLPAQTDVRGDVTLAAGATISAAEAGAVRLEVVGTLTVEAGAVLEVSGQGYRGGHSGHPDGYAPSGVVASSPDAGGSHGGSGVFYDGAGPAGEVYDSVYLPRLGGGGGALRNTTDTSYESGAGGGVVEIVAGSLVLDGEIRARGEDRGNFQSGGAGGSVVLDVSGTLSGTGSLDAAGGDSTTTSSFGREGGGGGGRLALYVGSLVGFDPSTQVSVQGGVTSYSSTIYGYGAPGTLLVFTDGVSTYGDLYVDAGAALGIGQPNTTLPTPGTGTVGVAEADAADPADLWIEPQDPAAFFDVGVAGMWLRVNGSDYPVLDQSADRRRVLLDGAAGLVSVGDAYAGVYKFDLVTVRRGAVLEFLDTAEVTAWDIDADSQVITPQP